MHMCCVFKSRQCIDILVIAISVRALSRFLQLYAITVVKTMEHVCRQTTVIVLQALLERGVRSVSRLCYVCCVMSTKTMCIHTFWLLIIICKHSSLTRAIVYAVLYFSNSYMGFCHTRRICLSI